MAGCAEFCFVDLGAILGGGPHVTGVGAKADCRLKLEIQQYLTSGSPTLSCSSLLLSHSLFSDSLEG